LIAAVAHNLSACVVFPVTRTYFEPNAADGSPTPSRSCGYYRTAKDGLEREVDGIVIGVHPTYLKDEDLLITVSFHYEKGDVSLDPDEISMSTDSGHTYRPKHWEVEIYAKDKSHSYRKWLFLEYPVISSELDNLNVNFSSSAVLLDQKALGIGPFRFKKITKSDVFYGSVNC